MSSTINSRMYHPKTEISSQSRAALTNDGVQEAVKKLNADIKNNASKDVIERDKNDAFTKYQAAGGQASSLEAFGKEASSVSHADTAALRQAFGLAAEGGARSERTSKSTQTDPQGAPAETHDRKPVEP